MSASDILLIVNLALASVLIILLIVSFTFDVVAKEANKKEVKKEGAKTQAEASSKNEPQPTTEGSQKA